MKTAITATLAAVLLGSTAFISTASAAIDLTAEREARTAKIEALYAEVRSGRMSRSEKIQALLDIARLEAEERKERRQQDRIRDREAALNS
ncbi:MAG: hypothetical protein ACPGSM_04660 [Thiolinea sp.]